MLWRMRSDELLPAPRVAAKKGQLIEGFKYVKSSPVLSNVLIMMAIIGMLTYEFSVVLPLLAEFTFNDGASGYAALTAAFDLKTATSGDNVDVAITAADADRVVSPGDTLRWAVVASDTITAAGDRRAVVELSLMK